MGTHRTVVVEMNIAKDRITGILIISAFFGIPLSIILFPYTPYARKMAEEEAIKHKIANEKNWLDEYCDTHSKDACELMEEIELEKQVRYIDIEFDSNGMIK